MPHTRRTIALDEAWDIKLDETGLIGVKEGAEATAQAVANECRLFTNDAYFIQDRGTPYFLTTLGHQVGTTALRSYMRKAAQRVDDVQEVTAIEIEDFDKTDRTLSGEISFTTVEGETLTTEL